MSCAVSAELLTLCRAAQPSQELSLYCRLASTANQLVLTPPVAKKCSAGQPIGTVLVREQHSLGKDNRFFRLLNKEVWETRDLAIFSDHITY